jgi:hypothetical protein
MRLLLTDWSRDNRAFPPTRTKHTKSPTTFTNFQSFLGIVSLPFSKHLFSKLSKGSVDELLVGRGRNF